MASDKPTFHGGDLSWACRKFGVAKSDFIDLSTGISPWTYPCDAIPEAVFRQLPYNSQQLVDTAAAYYGCANHEIIISPGSQYAIEHMPQLSQNRKVALPYWGYQEHRRAWLKSGHRIFSYRSLEHLLAICNSEKIANVVVINPNNPSAVQLNNAALRQIETLLIQQFNHRYLLVIDEAFKDCQAECSYFLSKLGPGCVVLRSLGKFFGLAGIRLGFVLCSEPIKARFSGYFGLWLVNGPALFIAERALRDKPWIALQHSRIHQNMAQWGQWLTRHLPQYKHRSMGLFHSVFGEANSLEILYTTLARNTLLARYIQQEGFAYLRFGLPGEHYARCADLIEEATHELF
ncbi:MAG: aminotransferase class I/II-fold pyridoxal phosphate-dependent enzyme [Cellvibrionaceae bacterium]|nr:aminotransferase class I/II-fold pyridoxal phosphate-dependent enzyme [Cellvibrionaceae bacterium]